MGLHTCSELQYNDSDVHSIPVPTRNTCIHTHKHTYIHTYIHMYVCAYIHTYVRLASSELKFGKHLQCRSKGSQTVAMPTRGEEGSNVVIKEAALKMEVGYERGVKLEKEED